MSCLRNHGVSWPVTRPGTEICAIKICVYEKMGMISTLGVQEEGHSFSAYYIIDVQLRDGECISMFGAIVGQIFCVHDLHPEGLREVWAVGSRKFRKAFQNNPTSLKLRFLGPTLSHHFFCAEDLMGLFVIR